MVIPSFTGQVPDNGYRWWYLDAISDDNQNALTIIAFIGSVFSPYYARARKKGAADPNAHCAINVALYGKPWRWCMTERTEASVKATNKTLSIGKSALCVEGQNLRITIDERAMPLPYRVTGELNIALPEYDLESHPLDSILHENADHFWQPIAPQTRINVDMQRPELNWQGSAYVDSNFGNCALENSFTSWVWSRTHADDLSTTILYDVTDRQGISSQRSLHYAPDGSLSRPEVSMSQPLNKTRYWRIPRIARTLDNVGIQKLQTLEDTPFYSRSRFIEQHPDGKRSTVHESLYLDRFDSAWVRCLLPFRMPRNTRQVHPPKTFAKS